MKRVFDFITAFCGIIALALPLAIVSVVIKCTSRGPVFYLGVRSGHQGDPFKIIKFRTMVADAEMLGGPSTGKHDPRVTSLGQHLRRYKIDELPNLFNVLRGEMSLVGPRPEVPRYTDLYRGEELSILTVRPGMTDLSSLEFVDLASHIGSKNVDETFERDVLPRKNALRVEYVRTQSFRGDLQILRRTLGRVLAPRRQQ